jgi:uncharacterized protein (UPF0261 family)
VWDTQGLINLGFSSEGEVAGFLFLGGEVGTEMIIKLMREQRSGSKQL